MKFGGWMVVEQQMICNHMVGWQIKGQQNMASSMDGWC